MSGRDKPAYICPRCGAESWSEQDAAHRYCGRCHAFEDPLLARLEHSLVDAIARAGVLENEFEGFKALYGAAEAELDIAKANLDLAGNINTQMADEIIERRLQVMDLKEQIRTLTARVEVSKP